MEKNAKTLKTELYSISSRLGKIMEDYELAFWHSDFPANGNLSVGECEELLEIHRLLQVAKDARTLIAKEL